MRDAEKRPKGPSSFAQTFPRLLDSQHDLNFKSASFQPMNERENKLKRNNPFIKRDFKAFRL